jgi:hypothetical protein
VPDAEDGDRRGDGQPPGRSTSRYHSRKPRNSSSSQMPAVTLTFGLVVKWIIYSAGPRPAVDCPAWPGNGTKAPSSAVSSSGRLGVDSRHQDSIVSTRDTMTRKPQSAALHTPLAHLTRASEGSTASGRAMRVA